MKKWGKLLARDPLPHLRTIRAVVVAEACFFSSSLHLAMAAAGAPRILQSSSPLRPILQVAMRFVPYFPPEVEKDFVPQTSNTPLLSLVSVVETEVPLIVIFGAWCPLAQHSTTTDLPRVTDDGSAVNLVILCEAA